MSSPVTSKKGQSVSTHAGKTTGKTGTKGKIDETGMETGVGRRGMESTTIPTSTLSYATRLIHNGQDPEMFDSFSVVPPIVLSTSFERCVSGTRMVSPERMTTGGKKGGKERHVEPGVTERTSTGKGSTDGKRTGEQGGRDTSSDKGIMSRIADTLGMGGKGTSDTRSSTGTSGTAGFVGLPGSTPDTTGTGSPEAKGTLGRGETGSPSLQNTGAPSRSETERLRRTGGGDRGDTDITRDTDGRGTMQSVAGGMAIPRHSVESGIGTFASTYESSVPARGIPIHPRGMRGMGLETHYGRMGNQTRIALENSLASLEDAKYAIAFPSGTCALTTCGFLLEHGNHVLVLDEVYSATAKFFRNCATRMGVDVSFVDMTDLGVTGGEVRPNTAMVWIETPTNPSLKIVDIKAVVDTVRHTNPNTIVVVDNTMATPLFQRPLELGADIVMHSLTKHINGHLDVVMGAIMTNRRDLVEKLETLQDTLGLVPSPFDCYLVNRSIKTFPIRMREQMKSANHIASYIQNHPAVSNLMYPGLVTHPQNKVFDRQMTGFGGVITFTLQGTKQDVDTFMNSLTLFQCAENVGGYVSLIEQPMLSELKDTQTKLTPNLIRLSIGLEDPRDLLNDLLTALERVKPVRTKSGGIGGTDQDQVARIK